MAHLGSRRRRVLALPVGLALTVSLGFLPTGTATAADSAAAGGPSAPVVTDGPKLSYVVNTRGGRSTTRSVEKAIGKAGGTVVTTYDRIGVIVVTSQNPDFAKTVRKVRGVDSAGATRTAPLPSQSTTDLGAPQQVTAEEMAAATAKAERANQRAGGAAGGSGKALAQDPLEPLQWDLPAIKADKAHEKTLGSRNVTVAVIDTGVDDTHPDIAPNFDRAASVNCVSGKPDTADGAWRPTSEESPHGTHVAGEIAGAKNGVGITGVAPGVKVAGIKASTPAGYFFTEAVVCSFVWAAEHGVDVTNNSYYTDPWYFNCTTDPDQKALVDAITRATRYAENKGTVNVAAAGNENYDLAADSITDPSSPNDSTPGERVVDPSKCLDIPTQLPGVVTVASTGAKNLKSSFSNHGLGIIDVAAPGGDSTRYQTPAPPATSGLILGPLPGGTWGYMAGTSMASPHAAGVAALLKSTHPHAPAWAIKALLKVQADDVACPEAYDIDGDGQVDAVCEGGKRYNSFYGAGLVDALAAVSK
ncbi:S8 family serine peptidase [Streptomyces sp. JV176]|uniref:S8 family peptidase n=1 Tax=Streptomyces sp. JV176 TaxID=858630 RepID=UPI002E781134|nr:S8 family serine peptidase [Streptomyces sp. JV176]MEE1801835.1 S8 family serine peptidase [Streptomyces sp. JV176]